MTRDEAITNYMDHYSNALYERRSKVTELCSEELAEEFDSWDRMTQPEPPKTASMKILKIFIVKDVADQFKYDTHSVF